MTTDEQLREATHTLEEATRTFAVAAIAKAQATADLAALTPAPPAPVQEAPPAQEAPTKKSRKD